MKTNRIPFSLEEYQSGKYNKVMYYNHEVRILATDLKGGSPILFSYFDANYNADVIERNNGTELVLEQTVIEDGDIVHYLFDDDETAIFKKSGKEYSETYFCYNGRNFTIGYNKRICGDFRLAKEAEKQRLFDALKKDGKRWNADKKCIEEMFNKDIFQPFQRVLARNFDNHKWSANLFSHYADIGSLHCFICVGNESFNQCIPFEGNEELLGTDKSPKQ